MIDCHVHLADGQFRHDIDDVIKAAQDGGLRACLVVTENADEFDRCLELADLYPDFVAPCLGVHPVQGEYGCQRNADITDWHKALPLMEKYVHRMIAVGEIGLDFNPRFCPTPEARESQREVLRQQIEFALKHDLAVNVHSCSAGLKTIHLMRDMGVKKALLHAFDGRVSAALEGVELGYYFSIPPSVIRSENKRKLVEKLPLENLILETDSPALGPVKQQRNVPANLALSCEFIAKTKGIPVDVVSRVTTENALKLFPKLQRFIDI